jgi:hypothetical protein
MISAQVVKRDPVTTDSLLKVTDFYYGSANASALLTLQFWSYSGIPICSLNLITQNSGEPIIDNTGYFIEMEIIP